LKKEPKEVEIEEEKEESKDMSYPSDEGKEEVK